MANIIVLFEVNPTKAGMKKYLDLAAMLKPMLSGFEGFIRAERFSSLNEDGKLLSMNVWTDETAVERWRNVMQHRMSQKEGREKLFESYKITVCSEIRSYTDTDRAQAPQDSNRYFGRNDMQYISHYRSPIGNILLAADEIGLTGLWFEGQKYFALYLDNEHEEKEIPIFEKVKEWLDIYFSGKEPGFIVPLHFTGTDFQNEIWGILCTIPYGQTMTYGKIAKQIAIKKGLPRMSAQAVGGAVGHNEISIIVPCHRVVGTNGSLTGYAGGIEKKVELLKLENVDMKQFSIPKKGTAL